MPRPRGIAPMLAILLAFGAGLLAPHPAGGADGTPLTEPMRRLGSLSEGALHWLMRNDLTQVQHVGIELVRTMNLTMGVAQTQGLSAESFDLLVDMRDAAEEMREEAAKADLKDAADAYMEMVETCMKCHVGNAVRSQVN